MRFIIQWQDRNKSAVPGKTSLIETEHLLQQSDYNPVLLATVIAFGFVFIHPLEDGNGRIHRYLIHHELAQKDFTTKGLVFPVSAVMFDRIAEYRESHCYTH